MSFDSCKIRAAVFLTIALYSSCFIEFGQSEEDLYTLSPPYTTMTVDPFLEADVPNTNGQQRSSLTVCAWTYISYFKKPSVIFSIRDVDSNDWEISLGVVPTAFLIRIIDHTEIIPITDIPLLNWNLICISIMPNSIDIYKLDKLLSTVPFRGSELLAKNIKFIIGGGMLWPNIPPKTVESFAIMNEYFIPNDSSKGAFAGKILMPKIFSESLPILIIEQLSICNLMLDTSQLNVDWQMRGENIENSAGVSTQPCDYNNFNVIFSPKPLTFDGNKLFCKRLHLQMALPYARGHYDLLKKAVEPFKNICGRDKWYSWLQPSQHQKNQHGLQSMTCEGLTDTGQESTFCQGLLCSGCQIERPEQLFILRGFCSLKEADLSFVIRNDANQLGYNFEGIEQYIILSMNNTWMLKDRSGNKIIARIIGSDDPIGLNNWQLESPFCGKNKDDVIMASFTTCSSDEALCNDGHCIPAEKRCDSYPDCTDASDEVNCDPILVPPNYFSSYPPLASPAFVKVSLNIIQLRKLPPKQPLSLLIETIMIYQDPRIQIRNLQPGKYCNVVNDSRLWHPNLSIVSPGHSHVVKQQHDKNTMMSFSSITLTEKTFVKVSPSSTPLPELRQTTMNDRIYAGAHSTIKYSHLFIQNIDCEFYFSFFPFDTQVCKFIFALTSWPSSRLQVDSNSLLTQYTGPHRLLQYTIDNTRAVPTTVKLDLENHSGISMSIILTRKPAMYALSVYLPSILILMINMSTLWMTTSNGRLLLSCLSLILFTLEWIFFQISTEIPGRLTAIDIWLCFCSLLSLLILTSHSFIDIFKSDEQPDPFEISRRNSTVPIPIMEQRKYKTPSFKSVYDDFIIKMNQEELHNKWSVGYWVLKIAKIVIPSLFVIFTAVYWPFLIYYSTHPLP